MFYLSERSIAKKAWVCQARQETIWPYEDTLEGTKPKVVTFYSFKGGMGRTTTLASVALQLARKGKNVIMVDTDIEAPGLATLFLDEELIENGVLDYLLEYTVDKETDISNYVIDVAEPGLLREEDGKIYVLPAGKVDGKSGLIPYFLPLRSYSKLADSKIFLITGGRGVGKSELFRVLISEGGLEHIMSESDRKRYSKLGKNRFLAGYQASGKGSKQFPGKAVLGKYAKVQDGEQIFCLWGGMLCAVLLEAFLPEPEIQGIADKFLGHEQVTALSEYRDMPEKWLGWMSMHVEKWEAFLERCDRYFSRKGETIFIAYDELDRICPEYQDLFLYIRKLLDFWFTHNPRWQNMKAKIFLRSDLYQAKSLRFVDSSKMRAYHLELQWDAVSLYRLFVKRLANSGNGCAVKYLQKVPLLLSEEKQGILGYLPGYSESAFKKMVEKMVGKYMGKTPKKGESYRWIPNHIQDANGELSPRAFLKCFVFAASGLLAKEDDVAKLEGERLLMPSSLQGALAEVSKDRVNELLLEEYGWLEVLRNKLEGQSMLMGHTEFLKCLDLENWPEDGRLALTGASPEELLDALKELGIFWETEDGRINVPEIYLHGFGLRRRGGIQRPKR